MKTLTEIDNTIDALKEVSSNALLKHGFSRSRQRIFDLSKSLDQTWQDYKAITGMGYYRELCLFVICRSAVGLRYHTIAKRSGLKRLLVHDTLTELLRDGLITKKIVDDKLIYRAKK